MATVSIIIPCYNAAQWIGDCLDSVLAQTRPIDEIIVVDDGSSDDSAAIAKAYGERITVIRQKNKGGNAARNVGFFASTGSYTQFLDADDIILPEKTEHQLACAEKTEADVVYGDWRHLYSLPGKEDRLGSIKISGAQEDVLVALLSGWWVSPAALFFRRSAVELVGGWDENLTVAQDRDFFTRMAMATNRIEYVPRCDALYRRYGNVTVGTSNPKGFAYGHLIVTRKLERLMRQQSRLSQKHREILAQQYLSHARVIANYDWTDAVEIAGYAKSLSPDFANEQPKLLRTAYGVFGFTAGEHLWQLGRSLRRKWRTKEK